MRITTTDDYFHQDCHVADCERRYCKTHRLLWRDCETAKEAVEGDRDVINGTHIIIELGDCPRCERESEVRRWAESNAGN
jgi:hypothetical protein